MVPGSPMETDPGTRRDTLSVESPWPGACWHSRPNGGNPPIAHRPAQWTLRQPKWEVKRNRANSATPLQIHLSTLFLEFQKADQATENCPCKAWLCANPQKSHIVAWNRGLCSSQGLIAMLLSSFVPAGSALNWDKQKVIAGSQEPSTA